MKNPKSLNENLTSIDGRLLSISRKIDALETASTETVDSILLRALSSFKKEQNLTSYELGSILNIPLERAALIMKILAKIAAYTETLSVDTNVSAYSDDQLEREAIMLFRKHKKASTSMLQTYLHLGYNKAFRVVSKLEAKGLVGPLQAGKNREVF